MRKEEKWITTISVLVFGLCLFLYLYCNKDQTQKDLVLLIGSAASGILSAVLIGYYLRWARIKQFRTKFPIEGTYRKFNNKGEVERQPSGKELEVSILHFFDYTYEFTSEYVWATGLKIATGSITFSDTQDGKGVGYYEYKDDGTEPNNGTYELLITKHPKGIRIWIKFENFYPYNNAKGAYWLQKPDQLS